MAEGVSNLENDIDENQRAIDESKIDMEQNEWRFDEDGESVEIANEYDEAEASLRESREEFTQEWLEHSSELLEIAGESELSELASIAADNPEAVEKITDFGENAAEAMAEMQGGGAYDNIMDDIEANKHYEIGDDIIPIDDDRVMVDENGEQYIELTDDELETLGLEVPEEIPELDNYEFDFEEAPLDEYEDTMVEPIQQDNAETSNQEVQDFEQTEGLDRYDFIEAYAEANPDDTEGINDMIEETRSEQGFELADGVDRYDFIAAYAEANPDDVEGINDMMEYARAEQGFEQADGLDRYDFVKASAEANPEDVAGNQELLDSARTEQAEPPPPPEPPENDSIR